MIKPQSRLLALSTAFVVSMSALMSSSAMASEDVVNIYSARKEALIKPLLDKFTEQTNIKVNLITGKADALLRRLEIEGEATPADMFITVDAGRLYRAKASEVLQPVSDEALEKVVPENLRDPDGYWFGLSQRARTIFYDKKDVKPEELSTYEDLADPKWKGRLCVRSSNNVYNQSLVVSLMEANGDEKAQEWAKGLVANFAKPPAGGDTDQLRAAAAGVCDIAVANTYYFGRLINSKNPEDNEIAEKLGVFWPNQDGRGVHVNVSGAGITKYAKNKETAVKLLNFLVTPESQKWYAEVNNEYPVVEGSEISAALKGLGEFKADEVALSKLGERNREAVQLMDRAGWK